MVSAQRQFPGDVFAGRSGVEGEFEVTCLTDEKAVGGQDSTIGIGDCEAEFAGAILCPSQRGGEQEKEGDVDQNTAQMDSPRSAENPRRVRMLRDYFGFRHRPCRWRQLEWQNNRSAATCRAHWGPDSSYRAD